MRRFKKKRLYCFVCCICVFIFVGERTECVSLAFPPPPLVDWHDTEGSFFSGDLPESRAEWIEPESGRKLRDCAKFSSVKRVSEKLPQITP